MCARMALLVRELPLVCTPMRHAHERNSLGTVAREREADTRRVADGFFRTATSFHKALRS